MGKRVSISTMYYESINYGGCLQAYALNRVVSIMHNISCCETLQLDVSQEVVESRRNRIKNIFATKGLLQGLFVLVGRVFRKLIYIICRRFFMKRFALRKAKFDLFREKMIPHSSKVYSNRNICETVDAYDVFITGSDQVWSTRWGGLLPLYWLSYVPSIKVKIAYAASISCLGFTDEESVIVKEYLADYDAISVREDESKILLDNVLKNDIDIYHTVDPTMLLTRDQWDEICPKRIIDGEYILAYLLEDSKHQRNTIMKYARHKNIKVVTLPHVKNDFRKCDVGFGDIKLYDIGPAEFVNLVKYSVQVFTDSYHGAIFAALFQRDFYAFKRKYNKGADPMDSRIYSLMNTLSIESRVIDDNANPADICKLTPIAYDFVDKKIEFYKSASLEFLAEALAK